MDNEKTKSTKKVKGTKVESIKRYIREILKKQELYRPELSYQIELTARDILHYRRLSDEALKSETEIMLKEISREGEIRYKINPIFDAVKKQSAIVQSDLKLLYMNRGLKRDKSADDSDDGGELGVVMEALTNTDDDD